MWPPGALRYRFGSFVAVVRTSSLLIVNVVVSIRVSSPVRIEEVDGSPKFEVERFLRTVTAIELIEAGETVRSVDSGDFDPLLAHGVVVVDDHCKLLCLLEMGRRSYDEEIRSILAFPKEIRELSGHRDSLTPFPDIELR